MPDLDRESYEQTLCVQDTGREPDGYDDPNDPWPYWICDCGHRDSQPFSFAEDKILLCGSCVLAGANRLWRQIAGEYLTWTNPPRTRLEPRKAISAKTRQKILERDAYRCRYCGDYINLVLDHIIPYVRTQDNSEENLATACQKCNAKKQDRTPEEARMRLLPVPNIK
jgi:hypothetical protein